MNEQQYQCRESEKHAQGREHQGGAIIERRVVATNESLLNLLLPNIAVGDEPDTHERKRDSDHLEGPGRALRQVRHQPSGTEADGKTRQPGSPPRQVGPFGRQPRASYRITGLIEMLCCHQGDISPLVPPIPLVP